MYRSTVTLVLLLSAFQIAMGVISPSVSTFFSKTDGNLTTVTWAHAVNSVADLQKNLNDSSIDMLEADIVLGRLINGTDNTEIPIMGHPPNVTSDLSLEMFLKAVIADGKKGIKLDFKTIEVFDGSKALLAELKQNMTFPVWINADILAGPVNATGTPVNASSFLAEAAKIFPESTLSIGWTTRYGKDYNITEGSYSLTQINEMITTIADNNVTQPITFPVRAGLAATTELSVMKRLIDETAANNSTLTIWTSDGDTIDADKLSTLIKTIGVDKVYVDVTAEVWSLLHISSGASELRIGAMTVGLLAIASQTILKLF